ncbi:MAG: terminase small subunit [Ferruginibacter sp.]
MKNNNNLTPKQERFCKEFIFDFHGKNAAIRSGYSSKTARTIASQLLTKESVQAKVKELTKANGEKFDVSLQEVIAQLKRWVWQDVRNLFNEDGTQKHIKDLSYDDAAALSGYEVEEKLGTGVTKKIKSKDGVKAMEILAKISGFMAPIKTDMTVTTPLTQAQLIELIASLRENKAP